MPRFHTEFFGREEEIAAIAQLLSSQRLVTLTGVGGSGKTRLAVEVAHDQLGSFDGGAYFADLSVVTETDQLWNAIARGVELDAGGAPGGTEQVADRVGRFLATRRALIVLDNCEHLIDAAGDAVEFLLDETRDLRVLATSREGLHVEGERIVQVPSLPLDTDAVRMFRERAAAPAPMRSTTTRRRRSASASTASRWRSSWPRRGRVSWGRRRWLGASPIGSGC